jgi:hypothetical protein
MQRLTGILKLTACTGMSVFTLASFAAKEGTSRTMPEMRSVRDSNDYKPSIGISSGLASPVDNRRNGTGYGIEAAYQPYIPISLGLELSGYVLGANGDNPTLTRTKLLAKALYNLGGSISVVKDSYFGLAAGPVLDNVAGNSDVELGVAPVIGFDIPLGDFSKGVSLGANANYMFVGGSKPDTFAVNGVAKYWF